MGILIDWLLPAALAFMMFSLGISLSPADFVRVLKQPKAFTIGALTQIVLLPTTAYGVAVAFKLPPELALGLFILALCPGGPTSNLFAKFARGDAALSVSLTAVITLVSILMVPLLSIAAGQHFLGTQGNQISVLPVAARSIIVMFIPISFGMWLKFSAPNWVARNGRMISIVSVILISGVILASVVGQWSNFVIWFPILGGACLTVMILMLFSGIVVGKIFGLSHGEASTISIDTAMQNAVMGITIGAMFATNQDPIALASMPSGIYGVMMYFVCAPFVIWRRRQSAMH